MSLHTTTNKLKRKYKKDLANFNVAHDMDTHYLNKLFKMLQVYNQHKKGIALELPNHYLKIKERHEVELALLDIKKEETTRLFHKYEEKITNIGKSFIEENSRVEKVSDKTKTQIERENCSICFEHHESKHIIRTSCNHYFGKYCFSKFIDSNFENDRDIVCPICRNDHISEFTRFK